MFALKGIYSELVMQIQAGMQKAPCFFKWNFKLVDAQIDNVVGCLTEMSPLCLDQLGEESWAAAADGEAQWAAEDPEEAADEAEWGCSTQERLAAAGNNQLKELQPQWLYWNTQLRSVLCHPDGLLSSVHASVNFCPHRGAFPFLFFFLNNLPVGFFPYLQTTGIVVQIVK